MNSRERMRRAIEFQYPDCLPWMHGVLPDALMKYGDAIREIVKQYPDDTGEFMHRHTVDPTRPVYQAGR